MKIGDLARSTGVATHLLRYYEEQGLLHPEREPNGYRSYRASAVERVEQIRELLESGLSTRVIRDVLPCVQGPDAEMPPCPVPNRELIDQLRHEITELDKRLECLSRSREALQTYLDAAQANDGAPTTAAPGDRRVPGRT